jgi:4-hydroxybenzoate polyprenyltransferase
MAWIKLLRIAALPSALSNILIGYLLAYGSLSLSISLLWLLISSASLYLAGMVLNDVFDLKVDQEQRPNRPIASGAISLAAARNVGGGLLASGVMFAAFASWFSMMLAAVLAVTVFCYDGPLKRTTVAPFVMGACRSLNILLGASTGLISSSVIFYAVAIGIFVAGITWLAKREAVKEQSMTTLLPGSLLMAIGMILAGCAASGVFGNEAGNPKIDRTVLLAFGFVCLPIIRRLSVALSTATSGSVQAVVITSLRSLIVFDACMAFTVENGRPVYSLVILSLLGVSWLLGRASKMT